MMMQETEKKSDTLLSSVALSQSLSAPRAPPHDSAQRALVLGIDPGDKPLATHFLTDYSWRDIDTVRRVLQQQFQNRDFCKHPHLREKTDQGATRILGTVFSTSFWNHVRDSGGFRAIVDGLITSGVPLMAVTSPSHATHFLELTRHLIKIQYGPHKRQFIDLFLPERTQQMNRLIFFVHGGAWGSNEVWMYRLVARYFLEEGWAVAKPSYKTYPDGDVPGQIQDLELAASALEETYPELRKRARVTFMGHSSGSHILAMMLVTRARLKLRDDARAFPLDCDEFVGISTPFNLSQHFDYEAGRGVEELSPLKAVAHFTRQGMDQQSPALQVVELAKDANNEALLRYSFPPRIVFVHGMDDMTVPFVTTSEAARIFRSCGILQVEELYLPKVGHEEAVLQLMMGGSCPERVIRWMKQAANESTGWGATIAAQSRL